MIMNLERIMVALAIGAILLLTWHEHITSRETLKLRKEVVELKQAIKLERECLELMKNLKE